MKPRQIQTFKLLAVAVAAAGCARTELAEPIAAPAPPAQPVQALAPGATATAETPPPPPAPAAPPAQALVHRPPPPTGAVGEALQALANELRGAGPEKARQQMVYFRPLCDNDGYPLVGNMVMKGAHMHEPYGPSAFCADVREQARR